MLNLEENERLVRKYLKWPRLFITDYIFKLISDIDLSVETLISSGKVKSDENLNEIEQIRHDLIDLLREYEQMLLNELERKVDKVAQLAESFESGNKNRSDFIDGIYEQLSGVILGDRTIFLKPNPLNKSFDELKNLTLVIFEEQLTDDEIILIQETDFTSRTNWKLISIYEEYKKIFLKQNDPNDDDSRKLIRIGRNFLAIWKLTKYLSENKEDRELIITSKHIRNELTTMRELSFSGFSVVQLDKHLFELLHNLKLLEFSLNFIEKPIESGTFSALKSLIDLNLRENSLSRLDYNQFAGLNELKTLCLTQNKIESIAGNWLESFRQLETLEISDNKIDHIEANLFNNDSVRNLKCFNFIGNKVNKLESLVFNFEAQDQCVNLRCLIIRSNEIESNQNEQQLNGLKELNKIDLFKNRLTNLNENGCGQFLMSELSELESLNLKENSIATLNGAFFIKITNLIELILSCNELCDLDDGAFCHLSCLKILDLSGNKLKSIKRSNFSALKTLTNLNLSENQIENIDNYSFESLNQLIELDLGQNQLWSMGNKLTFAGLKNLKNLHLNGNKIEMIHELDVFSCLSGLKYLSLRFNQLASFDNRLFEPLEQLDILDLSSNQLTSIKELAFQYLTNLTELSVENNKISSLDSNCFKHLHKLSTLNLGGNKLNKFNDATIFNDLGANLIKLDLGSNQIEQLNPTLFSNLRNLKHLLLGNQKKN